MNEESNFILFQRTESENFKEGFWDKYQNCSSMNPNNFVDNGEPDVSDLGDFGNIKSDFKPSSPPKINLNDREMVNDSKSGEHVNKSPKSKALAKNIFEAEKEIGMHCVIINILR